MDPHSLNESFQLNFTGNIYEPLVGRGKKLEMIPLLATSWKATDATTWRFQLRRNVKFHDGSPFTADDVIFSLERAKAEASDVKGHVAAIKEIRKVDAYTIDVVTSAPFPILPDALGAWYIMSKTWCEKNGATGPVDVRKGKENAATLKANGTGPFMLRTRQPGSAHGAHRQPGVLGQARRQRHRSGVHTHRQRRHAGRRAGLRRDRHDAAGAGAGYRAPVHEPQSQGHAGAGAPHHLPRHGPVARRAAVSRASRARIRSRTGGCARPSTRPSTSRRSGRAPCAAPPRRRIS